MVSVIEKETDTKRCYVAVKKTVRIIKKIREDGGQWRFVSLRRAGTRYVWDKRPGHYFVEWWEG